MFEYCLLFKVREFVELNDRQHGFREKYSTSTACLVLKETVFEYTRSNSKVYACFLDISKAFDSVSHEILITKLLKLGIPYIYVNMIKYCYSRQYVRVRYQNKYSHEWLVCNGVRQGGVLSGFLFYVYINDILNELSDLGIGCKLGIQCSNVIAYADDLVLLAPSATSLQSLLNNVDTELSKLELELNDTKSKVMIFSSRNQVSNVSRPITMGSKPLQIVRSIKYLGYEIVNDLDNSKDVDCRRSKFYSEFNQVLRKFSDLDKNVKLFLFKQYCLQIYGAELWFGRNVSHSSLKQFGVGYHKAIKKIIGVSYHESNHYSCQEAQALTFEHYINSIKFNFFFRLCMFPCNFMKKVFGFLSVSSMFFNEICDLAVKKYGINDLMDNDKDAVYSRILYIQNHETPLR